jgi:hypothetical protein
VRRPLSGADVCLVASCAVLFASILWLAVSKKPEVLWGVAGALWLVHVCWCWVLARDYWRPVRSSFWLVWVVIGAALILGCAGPGFSLCMRYVLEWVSTKGDQAGQGAQARSAVTGFAQALGLACVFGLVAMAVYPPFVLTKRRSDRVLFLLMLFQLPGVVLVIADLLVAMMPGPDGTRGPALSPGTWVGLAAGLAPFVPTVVFLGNLRVRGVYGTTPEDAIA